MRLLKLLTALLAVSLAACLWLAPGYVEIDIPVSRHKGGSGFWDESHRKLAYEDMSGFLYVYRQFGSTRDAHEWTTASEAFAYFDEHLRQRGWLPASAGIMMRLRPKAASSASTITSSTTGHGTSGTART